ncbi:maleylacetate reductase [Bradyrhizobium sp.]|uniref:maleylacetate reductase n=1 Tax=Bradyrhizobium sp. TaxID=376 RepID=UPI0025C02CF1|nr:maleylacetate reductase [Bradyrhizobium sp.]
MPTMHTTRNTAGVWREFSLPGGVYNATPPRILFGAGRISEIAAEIAHHGTCKALILSTPGRGRLAERVAAMLGDRCIGILAEAVSQVPIELAIRGRKRAREMGADCLVSIGGGASIGLGKGISLELGLPIVAVPTTYSGSEMTGFCGITIDGVKRMHTSVKMLASSVIYDPELTLTLPPDVSAASAFNALAHCIDAIYVPTVSPTNALAAVEGARVLIAALPQLHRRSEDPAIAAALLYGALLGGAALTGGFALQHGLAHVLGGSFGVPHGLSHAIVLPHVTAYNDRFAPEAVGRIAAAAKTDDLGATLFDLLGASGLPNNLQAVGLRESDLDRVADITIETDDGMNPAPVTWDVVRRLADDAYHGRRPPRR